MVWAIMFVALMILGRYGVDGLKDAGMVGAMIVAGIGVHNFLNTFWRRKEENKDQPEKDYWDGPGFTAPRRKNGLSLSSNARRNFFTMPEEMVEPANRQAARRATLYSYETW